MKASFLHGIISILLLVAANGFGESAEKQITLGFVGDIMVHNTQLRRAWKGQDAQGRDGGYDFNPAFEWFMSYLKAPDLTIGNLETTFGGPNSALVTHPQYAFREYQAYPTFTTPDELASALKNAGFDILGTANNHCMDSNLEGAARTLRILKSVGLMATGTSVKDSPKPWRGKVGDFNLSMVAWTASVNGLISPNGMQTINTFSAHGDNERLQEMLGELRDEAARKPDLLILFIHWGQEYLDEPNQHQKNLADLAIEAGVDIIIGSHPHVLQPIERRIVDDAGGEREVFIAWSLGNFISSQRHSERAREWVDGSAMLNLNVRRDANGKARVASLSFVPLYVHWSDEHIRVLAVSDGLSADAVTRYGLSDYDVKRLTALERFVPAQMTRYLGPTAARKDSGIWRIQFP